MSNAILLYFTVLYRIFNNMTTEDLKDLSTDFRQLSWINYNQTAIMQFLVSSR